MMHTTYSHLYNQRTTRGLATGLATPPGTRAAFAAGPTDPAFAPAARAMPAEAAGTTGGLPGLAIPDTRLDGAALDAL
jgi:hypothetical protein